MTTTYYEVLGADGKPATAAQRRAYGTSAYGYRTLAAAMRYCPVDAAVYTRHSDSANDWPGEFVGSKSESGWAWAE